MRGMLDEQTSAKNPFEIFSGNSATIRENKIASEIGRKTGF